MLRFLLFVCVALPSLNPFATGPSPGLAPWLFALFYMAVLIGLAAGHRGVGLAPSFLLPIAVAWLVAGLLSCVIGLLQYFGVAGSLTLG